MTKVYAEKDKDRYQISARGHATGSPEVCAAVSGDVAIDFRGGERAEAVFDMAVIGLLQIEQSCPEYIHVETMEVS